MRHQTEQTNKQSLWVEGLTDDVWGGSKSGGHLHKGFESNWRAQFGCEQRGDALGRHQFLEGWPVAQLSPLDHNNPNKLLLRNLQARVNYEEQALGVGCITEATEETCVELLSKALRGRLVTIRDCEVVEGAVAQSRHKGFE